MDLWHPLDAQDPLGEMRS